MKHTKGKWNLFLQDDNGFGITNGDSVIAIAGEDDLPENEANANLIASAPEMLTFLKEIAHSDKRWRAMNPKNNQGRYDIKLIDKVNYLIRKAEGGEL